ncbi:hypothetical protein MTR67_002442 [Solanum verrucosum]|uniref:Uncharacterized protein n=1 Tax=Solanum verrucosum TaxID=315347 RepID=A0AAF0PQK3_SOLVR|nr:hypothetical protein MTR67_002442 [Solanum verrucosum]
MKLQITVLQLLPKKECGCCMIQLCVESAGGELRDCIIAEILRNAKQLSENQYGYGLFSFSCAYCVGARDKKGSPIITDYYSSPLTTSGNTQDDMLLAKLEIVYTSSGEPGSSVLSFGLPVWSEWLVFNRVNARARKGLVLGHMRLLLSFSGCHVVGNFPPHEAFVLGGTNSCPDSYETLGGVGKVGCEPELLNEDLPSLKALASRTTLFSIGNTGFHVKITWSMSVKANSHYDKNMNDYDLWLLKNFYLVWVGVWNLIHAL